MATQEGIVIVLEFPSEVTPRMQLFSICTAINMPRDQIGIALRTVLRALCTPSLPTLHTPHSITTYARGTLGGSNGT